MTKKNQKGLFKIMEKQCLIDGTYKIFDRYDAKRLRSHTSWCRQSRSGILVLAFWGIISTVLFVCFDTNLVALPAIGIAIAYAATAGKFNCLEKWTKAGKIKSRIYREWYSDHKTCE